MGLMRRIAARIDEDPIILSHHPLCGKFDDHFFKVRGRRVCIGCVTVYPSAAISALVLALAGPGSFEFVAAVALLAFIANLPRFIARGHRLSPLFNALLGVSLGASLLAASRAAGGVQLATVALLLAAAVAFSAAKGYRVFATCKRCERYHEFPMCRGLREAPPREHAP